MKTNSFVVASCIAELDQYKVFFGFEYILGALNLTHFSPSTIDRLNAGLAILEHRDENR